MKGSMWERVKQHVPTTREEIVLGGILSVLAIITFQFLYPYDQALPNATLYDKSVGKASRDELATKVTKQFQEAKITLSTPSTQYVTTLASMGATVNASDAANQLTQYPIWQRLLPGSLWLLRPEVQHFELSFSEPTLKSNAKVVAKKLSAEPVDAGLSIKKGELVVTKSKDGQTVTAADVQKVLTAAEISPETKEISIPSDATKPDVADASIATVRKQAESILARSVTLQFPDGKQVKPTKADIAGWLKIQKRGDGLEVQPKPGGISSYIAGLNKTVATTGTSTQIRLVDGVQVSKKVGTNGTAINSADLQSKIITAINGSESAELAVLIQPVAPPQDISRSYTSSQKGLQAYASYLASEEGVKISVQQLSGSGWSASGGAYDSVVSASTYKLYVAVWVGSQIKSGKMKLSDKLLDTTVGDCLNRMIVISDNACAEAWIKKAGATNLNNFLYGKGISSATTFVHPEATHTSASDLQKVLLGIWQGTMVSGSYQSSLLGYMNRQVYRQGIPAGSAGKVYDKVGFLWDYLNDAAVVVHPKGTYSLVIMTKGKSWAHIADITRQVESIMY